MSIVFNNLLDASEKSADELNQMLRLRDNDALLCYELQDLMRNLVGLFVDIKQEVIKWQSRMAGGLEEFELKKMEGFGDRCEANYRRLETAFGKVFRTIGGVESFGFRVDSKRQFLDAWRELRGVVAFRAIV